MVLQDEMLLILAKSSGEALALFFGEHNAAEALVDGEIAAEHARVCVTL